MTEHRRIHQLRGRNSPPWPIFYRADDHQKGNLRVSNRHIGENWPVRSVTFDDGLAKAVVDVVERTARKQVGANA